MTHSSFSYTSQIQRKGGAQGTLLPPSSKRRKITISSEITDSMKQILNAFGRTCAFQVSLSSPSCRSQVCRWIWVLPHQFEVQPQPRGGNRDNAEPLQLHSQWYSRSLSDQPYDKHRINVCILHCVLIPCNSC